MAARFAGLIAALALLGSVHAAGPILGTPKWAELSAVEHKVLAPLADEWDSMDDTRKAKWLGVARRFPSMTAEEQERVQARMREWAKLTPEQRTLAREQYRSMRKSPAEQREALRQKWQEYENLPPEERDRLKEKSPPATGRLPARIPAPSAQRE